MKPGPALPPTMLVPMIHLVVNPFDSDLGYRPFCEAVFGQNRFLCMVEKFGRWSVWHLHIQGELAVSLQEFERRKKILTQQHFTKRLRPSSHPIKVMRQAATEIGFQYMAKDLPRSAVLHMQGFTDGDIDTLYRASQAHCNNQTPGCLQEYITHKCSRVVGETPRQLHWRMTRAALDYYREAGKMFPPQFQALVKDVLLKNYHTHHDVMEYLVSISIPSMVWM